MYSNYASIVNCAACLVMAAVLFFRNVGLSSPVGRAFRFLRRLVGGLFLAEAAMDITAMTLYPHDAADGCAAFCAAAMLLRAALNVALCLGLLGVQGRCLAAGSGSGVAEEALPPFASTDTMDKIVGEWVSRADKPFLREGVTVTQVADEMHISARLLSQYINNVKHVNFNTWINQLKTAEVMRIISGHADYSFVQIAAMTGFADAPAMSKTFKSIVGMSPSAYRNMHSSVSPSDS